MIQGLLLVDKPAGWTSFDVVNYTRRIVATAEGKRPKSIKVGHSGTLDPFATGLLVLLVGKNYTRQAKLLSELNKTYQVVMRLGTTSTTGDPEGKLTVVDGPKPNLEAVQEIMNRLVGTISQTPPIYSALKVNGQRAYKLARAGKPVVLEPRTVTIHSLKLTDYNYPNIIFEANVSAGTYIRSLVENVGVQLGSGAYTTALRRTRIGEFSVEQALSIEGMTIQTISGVLIEKLPTQ